MAFTRREFAYGAWCAWLFFQCAGALAVFTTGVIVTLPSGGAASSGSVVSGAFMISVMGGTVGLTASTISTLLGSPLAWLLGVSLRSIRSERLHLLSFAILGAGVGVATLWAVSIVLPLPALDGLWVALVVCGGVAVPFGQHKALRRARRADLAAEH
ncbi:hypothetical protein ACFQRL_13335 [Microbacterium fluvii]|uniref:Uncharacterized protein n=1 Tax=Microbacterium fluvii TaxID=415215 RepID=A0ABW2HF52_9MICO|nr:hypothetical protein [Microbacterium fluvii]MCU4673573.1 hypothetical protein [Microbacterium fluvii]